MIDDHQLNAECVIWDKIICMIWFHWRRFLWKKEVVIFDSYACLLLSKCHHCGVKDSLGITVSVAGLNDHQWYNGNDIEMFYIVSHSRLIVDVCLFCLPYIVSLSNIFIFCSKSWDFTQGGSYRLHTPHPLYSTRSFLSQYVSYCSLWLSFC